MRIKFLDSSLKLTLLYIFKINAIFGGDLEWSSSLNIGSFYEADESQEDGNANPTQ